MKISVIAAHEIDTPLRARWRELQDGNAAFASPYFCPEFTESVAAVRDDVRVAVLEDPAGVVGVFPFQRTAWGTGCPVGGPLSDHHGVIADAEARWRWPELLSAARLGYWRFDHLVRAQATHIAGALESTSPALDLSRGFQHYREQRARQGSRRFVELDRKARKLGREVGPLRFEAHIDDVSVLAWVQALKSAQCHRSGIPDLFASRWTRALVARVLSTRAASFSGVLSALYAGDTVVAAHFGMRSSRAWHWWFPVYERAHAPYSPGALLLVRVAEAAAADGAQMLDLGKGDDHYKESFADIDVPIAEGCVGRASLQNGVRILGSVIEGGLRQGRLAAPLRPAVRWLRHAARAAESQRRQAYQECRR
jgi:CelD/BcsL family acetyltransferase involved in cellulose biosynthesis